MLEALSTPSLLFPEKSCLGHCLDSLDIPLQCLQGETERENFILHAKDC